MPQFLYHATRQSSLDSIKQHGLQTSRYGHIHGSTSVPPPKPAVYLSRNPNSNNLHTDLFGQGPVVVLKIDMQQLDENAFYPDDFFNERVANGEFIEEPDDILDMLKCDDATAEDLFDAIENADESNLAELLKPFWRWYLNAPKGGEVAYVKDIPFEAIVARVDFTV